MITLTIPNDDHVALRAFGKALEEMALAHGAPLQVKLTDVDVGKLKDMMNAEQGGLIRVEPEIDTTAQQAVPGATHIITEQVKVGDPIPVEGGLSQGYTIKTEEIANPVDKTGTPWDERIHSTSKVLNADGSWRLRRKPKDMDEMEWSDYVAMIKADLQYPVECGGEQIDQEHYAAETTDGVNDIPEPPVTMHIDPAHDAADTTAELTIEPPVTPPGDDFHTDTGVVTEQTVAAIPPIPVPPPVVVPPAYVANDWDFPKLMTFLTERHGKIDVATVNTLLAGDGLSSIQELNAHPDKIGPFVARVKAHLGE
jgi:hypothetical protein